MLLKLKNSFNHISNVLNKRIENRNNIVKNTVMTILLSTGISASENIKNNIYITVNQYSPMLKKIGNEYRKIYTISPSDKPIFTKKVKIINGELFSETRLSNDHDITGYVKCTSFNSESRNIIKNFFLKTNKVINIEGKLNQTTKNKEQIKNNTQQKKVDKKNDFLDLNKTFQKKIKNTIEYAGANRNPLILNNNHIANLKNTLTKNNEYLKYYSNSKTLNKFLNYKISKFKEIFNFENPTKDITGEDLFDILCTLERKKEWLKMFSTFNMTKLQEYINKHYSGDILLGLNKISKKLGLKKDILEYNNELKNDDKLYVLLHSDMLIIGYEGFNGKSTDDGTHNSFGYGTKAPNKDATITRKEARKAFLKEFKKYYNFVYEKYPNLNKHKKIALISFFYNTGISKTNKKNFFFYLNNIGKIYNGKIIDDKIITMQMKKFNQFKGKINKGLDSRRKEEAKIYGTNIKKKIVFNRIDEIKDFFTAT